MIKVILCTFGNRTQPQNCLPYIQKNATGTTNEVTNDIFIEYKPEPESKACSTQFVPNFTKEPFLLMWCVCV